jgi:hypothetical protein
MGTISVWHKAHDRIKNLIERKTQPSSFDDLPPDRQETMCSEFLRLPLAAKHGLPVLDFLYLPIGRTMPDVDMVGCAKNGQRIVAQVTHTELKGNDTEKKFCKLRNLKDEKHSHLILFCDCEKPAKIDGINVFPIRKVYELFRFTRVGQRFLASGL